VSRGPNRVAPMGDLVAVDVRGAWMGNRGILYERTNWLADEPPVITRPYATKAWITCALEFRGWHALQWQPGHYTVLFFLDEAVALAAGHRPCALCRRPAYLAYRESAGVPTLPAKDLDGRLHDERLRPGRAAPGATRTRIADRRRLHPLAWPDVPTGAFVVIDGRPHLVDGDAVVECRDLHYLEPRARPTRGTADVLTPPTTVAALRGGYPVQIGGPG